MYNKIVQEELDREGEVVDHVEGEEELKGMKRGGEGGGGGSGRDTGWSYSHRQEVPQSAESEASLVGGMLTPGSAAHHSHFPGTPCLL